MEGIARTQTDLDRKAKRAEMVRMKQDLLKITDAALRWHKSGAMHMPVSCGGITVKVSRRSNSETHLESYKYTLIIKGEGFEDVWDFTDIMGNDIECPGCPSETYDLGQIAKDAAHQALLKERKFPQRSRVRAAIARILTWRFPRYPQPLHKLEPQFHDLSPPESPPPLRPAS
jgi:hypothetical protein